MGAMVGAAATAILVDEDERVARLCFKADFPITHDGQHPSDVDPTTHLYRLEEFQWKDFSNPDRGGFSVQRMSLFTRTDAVRILRERTQKKVDANKPVNGFDLEGVVAASVGEINSVKDAAGENAFLVTPEPVTDAPAHAAIRASGKYGSGAFLKYRLMLQGIFGELQPLTVLREDEE
jgi:hypothetical protein